MCNWHPLTKYVKDIKNLYRSALLILLSEHKIGNVEFLNLHDVVDFKYYLTFIRENIETFNDRKDVENLLKVFEPLDITVYNEYALFKYAGYIELSELGYDEAEFFYLYDGLYQECRSVVFNIDTEEIALSAMSKFKNYGEDDRDWSIDTITKEYNKADMVEITNKMDGSYQQFSWDSEHNCIIGSGSSALDVEQSWRLAKGFEMLTDNYRKMIKENPEYTFSFEFISVDNPIVVKYNKNQEGMYLFNMRSNKDGSEVQYITLKGFAEKYGVKYVESYEETLDSILKQLDNYTSDEKEGWVLRLIDYPKAKETKKPFKRVKIKVNDYVLMHRALSKLVSPNAIIEAFYQGKIDDFRSKIPNAYTESLDEVVKDITTYITLIKQKEDFWYTKMEAEVDTNITKDVMIWINTNAPKLLVRYLINRYKGNSYNYLSPRNDAGLLKRNDILKRIEILEKC